MKTQIALNGFTNYSEYSRNNFNESNKYWAMFAHLYEKDIKHIKNENELKEKVEHRTNELHSKDMREAYIMFALFHLTKI